MLVIKLVNNVSCKVGQYNVGYKGLIMLVIKLVIMLVIIMLVNNKVG